MLFNSTVFLVFFALVYLAYTLLGRRHRIQNWLLLVASYVFYGWWDWRFLSLLLLSTVVDYSVARVLASTQDPTARRRLLGVSLATNLGILGFFKYAGFFVESANELLGAFGLTGGPTLQIILPVGISFYTFQTLGYTIDVYRNDMIPTKRLDDFALYVAFFPQLVAGPIERAHRLLSQIERPRAQTATDINAGIWLILWGLFKKVVIADNVAFIADDVFAMNPDRSGIDVIIGALAFTIQIYGDFSGYSDIARGLAKLMGFELMLNFRLPYFARNPSDFWQRWHISLSSWLRDYLYIPLGGNRSGSTLRNLMITMVLGGLWHGAAWNFVLWGFYHGLILILYRTWLAPLGEPARGWLRSSGQIGFMFGLTVFGWIIFRSTSVEVLSWVISNIGLETSSATRSLAARVIGAGGLLAGVGIWQQRGNNLLAPAAGPWPRVACVYASLIIAILLIGSRQQAEFIYFQF